MSPATFAVNPNGARERGVAALVRRGTTFRHRLTELARVLFTIDLVASGRSVGGRCVRLTRANRLRRACRRYVRIGRFAQSARKGSSTKGFSGKIGRKMLRPGRYRATLVATDAAKNRSKPRYVFFRVVRG